MEKKLKGFKGGRISEDIYDKFQKDKAIDINGEIVGNDLADPVFDGHWYNYGTGDDEEIRLKASLRVREITDDPLEHKMADLILDYGYTEKEVAGVLNISTARVEWFLRKIKGWQRQS